MSSERRETSHVVHVPEAPGVAAAMRGVVDAPRPEVVAMVKALRTREMAALARHQIDHLNEVTGLDICSAIAGMTDAIIVALARRAFDRAGAPADWTGHVALFAVGGYGRGEQNPHSDIDLLVAPRDARPQPWIQAGNAELQTLLWDVGFQLGASLRPFPELERVLREDFVTATAVVEQRLLLGDQSMADEMGELLARFRAKRARDFLRYKFEEVAKRRAQAGASVFLMEPNLKSNPGCLRDVQLLRNIAFMVAGGRNLLALEELEVVQRADLQQATLVNDHLLMLRSLMHFHHGRKQDVLALQDQVRIATQLGYQDVSRLRAVEHLMKRHYGLVLHVHQLVELVASRLHARGHLGRKPILVLSRRVLDQDFTSVSGKVYVSHAGFWDLPDAGARLIRMCRTAQQKDLRLSFELQRAIRQHLRVIDDAVRHDRALGRVFLEILGDAGRVRPILSDMHACGLLGAYLPEFGNLSCHMQFDSYHQYTVDEHTLFALGNLDAVARGQQAGLPGMDRVFAAIRRKDLLYLGLLLHDMGKYMGRGHVARGALMVEPVAHRLGLDEAEEETVWFLVERHVALSDASRMRDFREPSFLKAFSDRIGSAERLDMLYCLTYGDAKAVGEGVLTGWQEALLAEIRDAVLEQLGQATDRTTGRHERVREELVKGGRTHDDADAFVRSLGDNYAYQAMPGEVARHARVIDEAARDGVGLIHEIKDAFVEVVAAVPDRHGLFADVTATISGHGFDIIDARTWISRGGGPAQAAADGVAHVLYHFRLKAVVPGRVKEEATWRKLRADLAAAGRGPIDAAALLARRRASLGAAKPADSGFDDPAVKVEQLTSDAHTIVDVHAKDRPGLLSRLCRAISDYGCDIAYACINTMGDVAVDVFYVSRGGAKLGDADADGLRSAIIAALELGEA
ncbi:MAG TPA: [protein-PII] uridylyltransferase [Planctomycetota bacterium]|nr:[protein-PII] uridylyltransferase [Planctomycetota bacterium]